jgi:hypothetical protein
MKEEEPVSIPQPVVTHAATVKRAGRGKH